MVLYQVLLGSAEAELQIVNSHRYLRLEFKVLGHQVKTNFLFGRGAEVTSS